MYFEPIFLPMCEFLTTHIGHLENIGSSGYAVLSNVDASRYIVWKITFVHIATHIDLIIKFFKYWEVVKLTMTDDRYKFSKILIFV